jgi:hypothetical protein
VPATQAFNPEIRAHSHYFPLFASAGMRLFQFDHIAYIKLLYHNRSLPFAPSSSWHPPDTIYPMRMVFCAILRCLIRRLQRKKLVH